MARFHGIWPAMPTPLTSDYEIDVEGTYNVVNFLIENGVHGISALGSTGECAGLTKAQRSTLLETTIKASNGRVPVMGGANGTSYDEIAADLDMAAQLGAVGALVPPPFYYPLSTSAVIDYFEALAEHSRVPIFLYHIPKMTKVAITVDAVERLARNSNIVGLKDSDGNFAYFEDVARIANEVDDFSAFTGADNMLYPALTVGGHGIIGATVNVVPGRERALYDAYQQGDHAKALKIQHEISAASSIPRLGVFPAGFKGTLAVRGLCGTTMTRPIPSLSQDEVAILRSNMEAAGLNVASPTPAD